MPINELGEYIKPDYIEPTEEEVLLQENKNILNGVNDFIKRSKNIGEKTLSKFESSDIQDTKIIFFLNKIEEAITSAEELENQLNNLDTTSEDVFDTDDFLELKMHYNNIYLIDKPNEYAWYSRFNYYDEQINKIVGKEKDTRDIAEVRKKINKMLGIE